MSNTDKKLENCVDCDPKATPETQIETKSENPLDASTFEAPLAPRYPVVTIEYCDRVSKIRVAVSLLIIDASQCRWLAYT